MTSEKQFEVLWKAGCKYAILAIIRNNGRALSSSQLTKLAQIAIRKGFVSHALTLARLAQRPLTQSDRDLLIGRCLSNGWVSDALHAARQGTISRITRQKLLRACVTSDMADTLQEARKLLGIT